MDNTMSLEQANEQLETIIKQLENEALPMQESVELYAKACELMALCMDKLNNYKGKIEEADKVLDRYFSEDAVTNG